MKKRFAIAKKNFKSESKKLTMVLLGFAGGTVIAKGLDWLATKYPQMDLAIKIAKPTLLAGGGLILSYGTTDDELIAKHLGYGFTIAGVYDGVKMIPVAKEFLSGFDGIANTYYTESDKPPLDLGTFGLNALPVKSFSTEDAPTVEIKLPDLGYNKDQVEGLGYNKDQVEGFNPDQTDMSGADDEEVHGIL